MKLILDREAHASNETINLGVIIDPDGDLILCTLENGVSF